ncbi:MAG: efflux transporter outer membrane subunit [Candidatus Binatia bacterium]
MNSVRWLAAALTVFVAAGCLKVGPDYVSPPLQVPTSWTTGLGRGLTPEATAMAQWWKVFGDPVLDSLVEGALAGNTDLRQATARVRQARAERGAAFGELFPAVDARTGFSRQRTSQKIGSFNSGDTDPGDDGPSANFSPERSLYSAGFDASWEIDIFGGRRRAVEQAEAELAGAEADLGNVLVTMLAEVATNYVDLRSLAERIAIAEANVAVQSDTQELASARYDAGLTGELELQQATYNLADTRARLPQLEVDLAAARHRLAVLTGAPPGALDAMLEARRPVPVAPASVGVGLPADLLRRRPDVAAAEQRLVAATAAVGVAKAEMYPKLSLSGSFGVSASDAADLLAGDAMTFDVGPTLRWRILDFGRIRSTVKARTAAVDEALAAYEATVLAAWEEAENAFVAYQQEQSRRDRLAEGAEAARIAEQLSRTQYESGVVDFQQVLEAQRAVRGFEDTLATSSAAVTTRLIALYKSLGGGW